MNWMAVPRAGYDSQIWLARLSCGHFRLLIDPLHGIEWWDAIFCYYCLRLRHAGTGARFR